MYREKSSAYRTAPCLTPTLTSKYLELNHPQSSTSPSFPKNINDKIEEYKLYIEELEKEKEIFENVAF